MKSMTGKNRIEILIAEDSPTQAEKLRHLLEQHGYRVLVAANGRQALDMAIEGKPRLIVSDIMMPEMDGYALCDSVKSNDALKDTPVILLTSLAEPQDIIKGLQCGADNFVRKPYDDEYLLGRINLSLANQELRRNENLQMGIEVYFAGQRYFITSERRQMLDLLISVYEEAFRMNEALKAREQQLIRSYESLHGLCRIAEGFNEAMTVQQLLDITLERALELPGVRAGWILMRKNGLNVSLAASRALPVALQASGAMEGDCLCLRRLLRGGLEPKTLILECERLNQAKGDRPGLRYHATVPLSIDGETIGLVNLVGEDQGLFGGEELKCLDTIGHNLAIALARIRLQEELEQKVAERTASLVEEIAERKRMEETIREQAALLDKARDAIYVTDLEHRISYCNKSAEELYGWGAAEIIGKRIEILYEELSHFSEAVRELKAKGEWNGELQHVAKDGCQLLVHSRWTLVSSNEEEPKSILVINTDITEKKKLESQFLRAQRMESIGTLAGGIAHDLNNVLTPILMAVQILREQHPNEQAERMLATLESNTKRGAAIVKQVLTFARGVRGEHMALQPKHLIKEISDIVQSTFPKSVRLITNIPSNLMAVNGDVTQLHQVLLNLCVNSRDAMPEGGNLTISAEDMFLDENYARMNLDAKEGHHVVLRVQDTGEGIPATIIDKVFDPFFTTKEIGKGTGLGLSTAHAIVKSHGGFVQIYSEPGKGTEVKVYLPAATTSDSSSIEDQRRELPRGHGELILVVDDEASIAFIAKATLESHDYKVMTAGDGAEALAIYAQHKHEIGAVLLDMAMPIMDGPATIRVLQKVNPKVRIIGTSGLSSVHNVGQNDTQTVPGIQGFLPKPFTAEKLLSTLGKVLEKR